MKKAIVWQPEDVSNFAETQDRYYDPKYYGTLAMYDSIDGTITLVNGTLYGGARCDDRQPGDVFKWRNSHFSPWENTGSPWRSAIEIESDGSFLTLAKG
jgi:hypothetical protein